MNPGDSGTTVLGRAAKFRGELTGPDNIVVEGEFEGVIRNPGATVTIGSEAHVRAVIGAQDVIVYGTVEGQIYATGSVSLRGEATVLGDVLGSRFSMEENAVVHGRVDPTRAGEPIPATTVAPTAVPPRPAPVLPPRAEEPIPATAVAPTAVPPRPAPVLPPRPVPAPEELVLRPVEPAPMEQPLFVTPPAEASPIHGTSAPSNSGRLPAGLAAAWRKMDSNAPADTENSPANDPSKAQKSNA